MERDVFDITILGGGPTGLYAAYYAGFRSFRVKLIDSLPELGGQITALYPEKYIYDVAGFPKIFGKDLVRNLVEQAMQFKPNIFLDEKVRVFERGEECIHLVTDKGDHWTRVILLSAGIGQFTPKKVPLPGVERFEGKGLAYFVKSLEQYRGKRVLIIGGGDSAVDWVLNLLPVAGAITLIHRRDGFRAHEDSVRKMKSSSAQVKTFYELKAINGRERVEEAVVFSNKTQQEEVLHVDEVVACLGFNANLEPLEKWGLETEGRSVKVNSRMETNVPGVYGAGDIVTYPGKVRLITTAFGEAATAINNAAAFINPGTSVFPGHSSEKKTRPVA